MTTNQRTYIIIPAFNEAAAIADVLTDIRQHGNYPTIVVDDGSTDATTQLAYAAGAQIIQHRLNRGKGAAVKTGLIAAQRLGAEFVITMDGDGQHQARDLATLLEPLVAGQAQVALGNRWHKKQDVPPSRRLANYLANILTWLLYHHRVADSQSGFRAYTNDAIKRIQLSADFYNFDSEVIGELHRHNIPYVEVPISVRYTHHSITKPVRQDILSGLKTIYKMIWGIFS